MFFPKSKTRKRWHSSAPKIKKNQFMSWSFWCVCLQLLDRQNCWWVFKFLKAPSEWRLFLNLFWVNKHIVVSKWVNLVPLKNDSALPNHDIDRALLISWRAVVALLYSCFRCYIQETQRSTLTFKNGIIFWLPKLKILLPF